MNQKLENGPNPLFYFLRPKPYKSQSYGSGFQRKIRTRLDLLSKRLGGIIGCKYKTSSRHLSGFPYYGSNIGSTVLCRGEDHRYTVHRCLGMVSATSLSLSMQVRFKNEIAEWEWSLIFQNKRVRYARADELELYSSRVTTLLMKRRH